MTTSLRGHGRSDDVVRTGETGAPGSEGREAALATCIIRGCGVVALGYGTHCRRHQAQLDHAANQDTD